MRSVFLSPLIVLIVLLAACAAPSPLPDFRYYTLPGPELIEPVAAAPKLDLPLVVGDLRASGVRGERPILYSSSADRTRLLQYHYQLWSEPPTVLVRDSLLRTLEKSAISTLVTDRLSMREPAVRLSGELTRFDRMRSGGGWSAAVEMRLRASLGNESMPLIDRRYFAEIKASDELLENSIAAFRQALDQISAELLSDLRAVAPQVRDWRAQQP
jgi:ABC-type uncharacterized transport system auxiliary subunit